MPQAGLRLGLGLAVSRAVGVAHFGRSCTRVARFISIRLMVSSYSLPYVARRGEGDTKVIALTAERVVTAARMITEAIEALEEVSS